MADFEEKMKTTKQTLIIDKDFVKVKKNTFDSMNNVISESKKVMELQPKLQTIFNEVDSYANSYKSLEEKKKFSVEILFNIFQYDFKNEEINILINQKLNVYDYYYSLNVL